MKVFALALLFLTQVALADAASNPPIAQNMKCEDAVEYYQQHKRIWVRAAGDDVVPLYGPTPYAERSKLICRGRQVKSFFWVNTLDDRTCVIGMFCRSR